MNKTFPALAGIALSITLVGCAAPNKTDPILLPTVDPSILAPTSPVLIQPRQGRPKQATPRQQRPVDIEPQPWNDRVGTVYEFRVVVDEVTRYCLVVVGGDTGGMHCFDSAQVPK